MTRTLKIAFTLALVGLLSPASPAALIEKSSGTSITGEGGYASAIIDTTGGFAYFGSSNSIGLVTSVSLAPFGINAGVTYFPGVANFSAAAFDTGTRFAYFASSQAPASIQLIPFGGGVQKSSITFDAGENAVGTAVIDSTNHFAYFGTQMSPSTVIKVRLPDGAGVTSMAVVSSITLPAGLENLSASVIDTQNGFAYFASSTTTGAVVKIRLSDFTQVGKPLTFNPGEGGVGCAVIDIPNQFAYFGTHDTPGKIVQVRLSDLSRVNALTLPAGQNDLTSAVFDPARGFAYFGTNTSSGIVAQVLLTNMSELSAVTLKAGEDFLTSAVIDSVNGYAYFGTFTTPGRVIQMDLLAGPPTILSQPADASAHPGETATFSVRADGRNLTYQWQMNGADIAGATSASYARTVFTSDDQATFQCVVTNDKGSVTSRSAVLTIIPVIRAYPNPWRPDRGYGVDFIKFDGLLPNSTVKIFTLSAHWIKTLPVASGTAIWDRTNDAGQTVASGYYVYLVTTGKDKQTSHGMLAIIK